MTCAGDRICHSDVRDDPCNMPSTPHGATPSVSPRATCWRQSQHWPSRSILLITSFPQHMSVTVRSAVRQVRDLRQTNNALGCVAILDLSRGTASACPVVEGWHSPSAANYGPRTASEAPSDPRKRQAQSRPRIPDLVDLPADGGSCRTVVAGRRTWRTQPWEVDVHNGFWTVPHH